MLFRPAEASDFDAVMGIIEDGRAALAALGIDQWQGSSPNADMVRCDMAHGFTHVAVAEEGDAATVGSASVPDMVLGSLAFVDAGEADYSRVTKGAWLLPLPNTADELAAAGEERFSYACLHRVATSAAAVRRGVASFMIRQSCDMARSRGLASVRIDTHEGNIPMQRMLGKLGFAYCCDIELSNPTEPTRKRLAYELVL